MPQWQRPRVGEVDIASPFTGTLVEIFLDNGVTDLTTSSQIFAVVRGALAVGEWASLIVAQGSSSDHTFRISTCIVGLGGWCAPPNPPVKRTESGGNSRGYLVLALE